MYEQNPKLVIGFITYGKSTAKYLPYFLPSIIESAENYENTGNCGVKILVFDNSEEQDNKNVKYIKKNYPDIEIEWVGKNFGFARAHNRMINKAVEMSAEYFLAINPDMILEPDAIKRMIKTIDNDGELGSVCPKILRWDFQNNKKTNVIDSCGIQLKSGLRFIDVGQGQVDEGQFDDVKILGPSGAAGMYRIRALKKIIETRGAEAHGYASLQFFDELMFMYKEDCDLAYRLFLAGFKSKCVAGAIVYHDRTAAGKGESNLQVALNRRNKSKQAKKWSFLNQQIIFVKYWQILSIKQKLEVLWFAFRMFAFTVVFEQYLLKEYGKLWRLRNKIKIFKKYVK